MAAKKTTKKATPKAVKEKGAFAVIMTGGKQYKVHAGETLKIEKLAGEPKIGDTIKFDRVLLTDDGATTKIGTPEIKGVTVEAKLLEIGKAKKIEVIKYLQKSRYLKTRGHRQPFMKVEIISINQ
ncbi:MAG: 50S ribosomal protein L21 [Candidatus Paceibacterota bacterium]|jgi:large subunit ribosomal protein L21